MLSTEEEIAGALGESRRTVATLRRKGAIPYLSLGHRTVRFKLADVLAALEKRTIKAR
ncbi:MAG: helix-turn-helix domain-containing protein [Chthoniobacterales bacterium]|nr:helix-turn-helix domain-containing protein [Chthoniobacterales bacterium]